MTLDEVLKGLFPGGHDVAVEEDGTILGKGKLPSSGNIAVVGFGKGEALGGQGVLALSKHVLETLRADGQTPILVLVDLQGQLMARREEMIGLNEYLAHLAKCLILAGQTGHRTIGLEYGKAAAGGLLATAFATEMFVALPGAEPAVMDLPSMARVTKLPQQKLKELAKSTPVFAPGIEPMLQMGALSEVWDPNKPLAAQLEDALGKVQLRDTRDELGAERKGRPMAAAVTKRVVAAALGKKDDAAAA